MRKAYKFLQRLHDYAKIELNQKAEMEKIGKHEFLASLNRWEIVAIYENCTIKDGCLFNEKGVMLSDDGCCMNESIPYFVNQSTGYCEDDYYGTMFVCVSKGTFVAVFYEC